jgi:hypothetical protein
MVERVLPTMSATTIMTAITGAFIATSLAVGPKPTHSKRAGPG